VGQISKCIHSLLERGGSSGEGLVTGVHQILRGRKGGLVESLISGIEVGLSGLGL